MRPCPAQKSVTTRSGEDLRNEPSQVRLIRPVNYRLERDIRRQVIERSAERSSVRVYRRLRGGQHRTGPQWEHTNLVPAVFEVSSGDRILWGQRTYALHQQRPSLGVPLRAGRSERGPLGGSAELSDQQVTGLENPRRL